MMPALADLRRIRAVLIDAMFTIFQPAKAGRRKMLCGVYRQPRADGPILLPRDQYTDHRIWNCVQQHRRALSPLKEHHAYWRFINTEFYRDMLNPDIPANELLAAATRPRFNHSALYAEQAHDRILTDVELWRVQPSMLSLLKRIKTLGAKRIIASNQREEALRELLRRRGVIDLADRPDYVDATCTSEALDTNKPFPEFWERILAHEGLQPDQVIHVGNSPVSDVGACDLGIHVVLYDLERELDGVMHGDFSEVAIPYEREHKLRKHLAEGRITIVHTVPELRSVLLPMIDVEQSA